jgi:transmembrane sensor
MPMRPETPDIPSAAARAEAAVWIARLHGPHRTKEVEEGFRRWLAEDGERKAAFELLTDTWEKTTRLKRRPSERMTTWRLVGFRVSLPRAAIASISIALGAVLATALYLHTSAFVTAVGEQRTMVLDDGSRIYLNTNSRVVVHYDKATRRVDLQTGEALFEVAKRPDWPFIVTAGDRQIRALGTEFIVRRDEQELMVTLVEGKVTVAPRDDNQGAPSSRSPQVMSPGQRLTFVGNSSPKMDSPAIERVTAWQRGQISLDNTPLPEAIAEMNRYSKAQIRIENAALESIRISGIFRAGDYESFSEALVNAFGVRIDSSRGDIALQ